MGELEEYLTRHPDAGGGLEAGQAPGGLEGHFRACRECRQRWRVTMASRMLLTSLRSPGGLLADPYFYGRVRARIEALAPAQRWVEIRWRHLVLASLLFATALGSFVYNIQRTETPNADEAMVLDVPHLNPQHPEDSHLQPRLADVMLNLMNP
ncbi:MAG: hypothetical protein ACRD1C_11730 [Terriglobales bacterium]